MLLCCLTLIREEGVPLSITGRGCQKCLQISIYFIFGPPLNYVYLSILCPNMPKQIVAPVPFSPDFAWLFYAGCLPRSWIDFSIFKAFKTKNIKI